MPLLPDSQLDHIMDAVMDNLGYPPPIRRIFLSAINAHVSRLLAKDDTELIQLNNDLISLNNTGRLTDGTLPLQSWLDKATRFLKPFPEANRVIQLALAAIARQSSGIAPLTNVLPPSPAVMATIVKEKIILQNDMVSYAFLESGWRAGNAVARMKVPRYERGVRQEKSPGDPVLFLGTGWLLTPDLVITNHHVIGARNNREAAASPADFEQQALNTLVEFDYNSDYVEGALSHVSKPELADADLDFAIVRLTAAVDRHPPRLLADKVEVTENDPQVVNIIQHPFGQAKKVALRNNHVFDASYPKLRYFTDTEGGSSGSGVFNDNWQVLALHHAATLVDNVPYQGQTTAWVNEGIQLHAILEFLQQNAAALAKEITDYHTANHT